MKNQSNRRQLILKFISLLSIVRWYNVLIVAIAMYFSALFLLNDVREGISPILFDPRLHLAVFSVAFLMMAGFIINAFYDFEKDIINRPMETIFGRIVSKSFCLNTYVLFIFLGLLLALFVGWKVLLFNFLFSFGMWFYSHKLRKKPFSGELSASLLTIAPFFSISLYYFNYNQMIFLYVGYIFVLSFTREVIKKMISLKGDLIVGEKSLPILLGIRKTKLIILGWMLLAVVCILALLPNIYDLPILWYFIFALLGIGSSIFVLRNSRTPAQFNVLNRIYKIILILAILSIPLVGKWW